MFFETIYNFPVSKHIKKTNYLREKYSISDKQNILIYQGIIEGGRGIKSLLGCVQRDSSLCAVIVGAGPDKEYYKKLTYRFKINNRCFFHDQVEYKNLLAITSSADLGCALIQPNSINNNYALPNKIFEYAHCGLPVLASNLPIMSTYIKKYKLGICINSKNKEGLNKAISFLLKNKKQYMKNQHLKALSWQAQDQKFLEICT